ncbi:MAG: hypothetical protein DRH43_08295 [Deltaproteobacteria bacterium]|nr:MAG: hypothetical protein DRH43_08295 [Deltaproteobacteria bacterium]
MGKLKHRTFNADRFLDKFQGQEDILRSFVGLWDGRLVIDVASLDVPLFKEFLVNGDGDGKDELLEGLYQAYDLCTERGHEDLVAACCDYGYSPDGNGELPVECLSLKVRTENEDAFTLAYDRYTLWRAERFTIFRGKTATAIPNVDAASTAFQSKLAEVFKDHKNSDRVLVRHYQEDVYTNFIIYHEKRTKAELIFKGTRTRPKVSPTILRPAQQDFISYNHETGQVEIEASFEKEETALRKAFAECCLKDPDFFDSPGSADRLNLARIAEDDFEMPVDEDHSAVLAELHFNLKQQHGPSFVVRSKNVMETLDKNYLRKRLAGGTIRRAVFKITFPDDRRGKRIELSGTNKIKFKRATHAEEVFRYLSNWGIVID